MYDWMGGYEPSSKHRLLQQRSFRWWTGRTSWMVPPGLLRQRSQVPAASGRDPSRPHVYSVYPKRSWTGFPLLARLRRYSAFNSTNSFHCWCQPQVWWQAANGNVFLLKKKKFSCCPVICGHLPPPRVQPLLHLLIISCLFIIYCILSLFVLCNLV